MKKILSLILVAAFAFSMAACESPSLKSNDNNGTAKKAENVTEMPQIFDATQYTLYQNIFFNDQKSTYENTKMTVDGIFTTLYDCYNDMTRYYVWGYYDQTMCCDWQWEIKMPDGADIPSNGSEVTVIGTFTADDKALDKYWLTNSTVDVSKSFKGPDYDIDMTTMNGTLARVQIQNIQYKPEQYKDENIAVLCRVASASTIQHPYYDGAWTMDITGSQTLPAIGTTVILTGKIVSVGSSVSIEATDIKTQK